MWTAIAVLGSVITALVSVEAFVKSYLTYREEVRAQVTGEEELEESRFPRIMDNLFRAGTGKEERQSFYEILLAHLVENYEHPAMDIRKELAYTSDSLRPGVLLALHEQVSEGKKDAIIGVLVLRTLQG